MTADQGFRIRCLVALNWDAPRAFEARVQEMPKTAMTVEVQRFKEQRVTDWTPIPDTTYVKRDILPIRKLMFQRPPDMEDYDPFLFTVRVAYDRITNTIFTAGVEEHR